MSDCSDCEFKLKSQPTFASSVTDVSHSSSITSQESDQESEYEEAVTSPQFDDIFLRADRDKANLKSVFVAGYKCDACAQRAYHEPEPARLIKKGEAEACENCGKRFLQHYEHDVKKVQRDIYPAIARTKDAGNSRDAFLQSHEPPSHTNPDFQPVEESLSSTLLVIEQKSPSLKPPDERDNVSDTSTVAPTDETSKGSIEAKAYSDGSAIGNSKAPENISHRPARPAHPAHPHRLPHGTTPSQQLRGAAQRKGGASAQLAFEKLISGVGSAFGSSSDPSLAQPESPALSSSLRAMSDSVYGSVRDEIDSFASVTEHPTPSLQSRNAALPRVDQIPGPQQGYAAATLGEDATLQLEQLSLDTSRTDLELGDLDRSKPRSLTRPRPKLDIPLSNPSSRSSGTTSPSPNYTYSPIVSLPPAAAPRSLPQLPTYSNTGPQLRPGNGEGASGGYRYSEQSTSYSLYDLNPALHGSYTSGSQFAGTQNISGSDRLTRPPNVDVAREIESAERPALRYDCPARKEHPDLNDCCANEGFENASRVKEHLKRRHCREKSCPRCGQTHGPNGSCTGRPRRPGCQLFSTGTLNSLKIRYKATDGENWWGMLWHLFGERERPRHFDCWYEPALKQFYPRPAAIPSESGFAPRPGYDQSQYLRPRRQSNQATPSQHSNDSSNSAARSAGSSQHQALDGSETPSTDADLGSPCPRRDQNNQGDLHQLVTSFTEHTDAVRRQRRQLLEIANGMDEEDRSEILKFVNQRIAGLYEDYQA